MVSPFKIVSSIIKLTLYVGLAGGLVDITRDMGQKAGKARRHGLISLTELNKQLYR